MFNDINNYKYVISSPHTVYASLMYQDSMWTDIRQNPDIYWRYNSEVFDKLAISIMREDNSSNNYRDFVKYLQNKRISYTGFDEVLLSLDGRIPYKAMTLSEFNVKYNCDINELSKTSKNNKWVQALSLEKNPVGLACFIPKCFHYRLITGVGKILTINHPASVHGLGDFILIPIDDNGKKDIKNAECINGTYFSQLFETTNWERYLTKDSEVLMYKDIISSLNNYAEPELQILSLNKMALQCIITNKFV